MPEAKRECFKKSSSALRRFDSSTLSVVTYSILDFVKRELCFMPSFRLVATLLEAKISPKLSGIASLIESATESTSLNSSDDDSLKCKD